MFLNIKRFQDLEWVIWYVEWYVYFKKYIILVFLSYLIFDFDFQIGKFVFIYKNYNFKKKIYFDIGKLNSLI